MGLLTDPWRTGQATTLLYPTVSLLDAAQAQQDTATIERWSPADYPFREFVAEAWMIVDQRPFIPNWHIDATCDHAQAVFTGEIRNLLINEPPRHAKSLVMAVMFNAWCWVMDPGFRLMYFSYAERLAMRDARKCRELVRSDWYQRQWGDRVQIVVEGDRILHYSTTAGGHRITSSIGGVATGMGADLVIVDDPHKVDEDRSDTRAELEEAVDFVFNTLPSRVEDFNTARQIIVGQRVATDDVSSHVINMGTHECLILPVEYEPPEDGAKPVTALGWSDPRLEAGELLFPARMNRQAVDALKKNPRLDWAAQFQQHPEEDAQTLFPKTNWRYFQQWPDPDWFDILVQSWDMRFKDAKDSGSYVAGHVWGRKGPNVYLLDRYFARASFPETQAAVLALSQKWPDAHGKLIENKANGPAIAQSLRTVVPGVILVDVEGSKFQRAQAVAMFQHSGNCWLPHERLAPWVIDYIRYMEKFPAPPDDDTDATTQAWRKLLRFAPATDERAEQQALRDARWSQVKRALTQQQSGLRWSRTNA